MNKQRTERRQAVFLMITAPYVTLAYHLPPEVSTLPSSSHLACTIPISYRTSNTWRSAAFNHQDWQREGSCIRCTAKMHTVYHSNRTPLPLLSTPFFHPSPAPARATAPPHLGKTTEEGYRRRPLVQGYISWPRRAVHHHCLWHHRRPVPSDSARP